MPRLELDGQVVDAQPGETVLTALLRAGASIRSSCRAGACQSCLLRATSGAPDPQGQQGLKDTLRERGYFLSCITPATSDLVLTQADADSLQVQATIQDATMISDSVLRLRLHAPADLPYRAGQFINILRDDGLTRSYSLASVPGLDSFLELHVRLYPNGRMSGWLRTLGPGHTLTLRGPTGECFYVAGRPAQPLLLLATGTGLAPLWGIVRDALQQGHHGPVVLLHGSRSLQGLYYQDELRQLAQVQPALRYMPCVLQDSPDLPADTFLGSLSQALQSHYPKLSGWRVFLCGAPDVVQSLRRQVFLAGVSRRDIAADAFVPAASEAT